MGVWMRNTLWASVVKVPVLSQTTRSTSAMASSDCKSRTKTPWRARFPAAASIAAGVAKDKAHGQVTINTATATISACPGLDDHDHAAAPMAANNTIHKKGLAQRSAKRAKRGLLRAADAIKATVWA